MGSLLGAVVGGFLASASSSSMLQAYLPEGNLRSFRDAFAFTFVILILLFRPSGHVPTHSADRSASDGRPMISTPRAPADRKYWSPSRLCLILDRDRGDRRIDLQRRSSGDDNGDADSA